MAATSIRFDSVRGSVGNCEVMEEHTGQRSTEMITDYEYYSYKLKVPSGILCYDPRPFTHRQVRLATNALKWLVAAKTTSSADVHEYLYVMRKRDPNFYDAVVKMFEKEGGFKRP